MLKMVLVQQGVSLRDVAAAVGASTATIAAGGFAMPAKRPDGKQRDSPQDVQDRRDRVAEVHREDQKRTSNDIRWILAGEGVHVSKRTIARDHKALGGKHLEGWPPNSPDLSPIENLWSRLWADAMKLRPRDADELWSCVETVFNRFDDSYIDALILSFRKRLELVVEHKGESISDCY
jgi:transposase